MKKLLLIIATSGTLIAFIVWLWTIQPQGSGNSVLSEKNQAPAKQAQQDNEPFSPKNNSILKASKITLKGRTSVNNFVAITQTSSGTVIKADASGNFEQDLVLEKGLNLVNVAFISPDLSKTEETSLTYYLDSATPSTVVYAGSIKTIFDTLVTITTTDGEKTVRTGQSTDTVIPKEEDAEEGTGSAPLKLLRIGDYAIALGNPPEKSTEKDIIIAGKLTIIRTNKPQINQVVAAVKTLSKVSQNSLSVKTVKDKIIDVTLDKQSDVLIDGKEAKAADIAKDKNAIIIYSKDDEDNILSAIYLLP